MGQFNMDSTHQHVHIFVCACIVCEYASDCVKVCVYAGTCVHVCVCKYTYVSNSVQFYLERLWVSGCGVMTCTPCVLATSPNLHGIWILILNLSLTHWCVLQSPHSSFSSLSLEIAPACQLPVSRTPLWLGQTTLTSTLSSSKLSGDLVTFLECSISSFISVPFYPCCGCGRRL